MAVKSIVLTLYLLFITKKEFLLHWRFS